jgi:hypothetical protein
MQRKLRMKMRFQKMKVSLNDIILNREVGRFVMRIIIHSSIIFDL